ncbi:MAG: HlyD family secretion protein [Micavibrio sp.]|nr:HlyD family secretion protein [Micavibrio sp.]
MNKVSESFLRFAVTGLALALAAIAVWQLYGYYLGEPWTRDGRVKADVVQVAPDVSGLITAVNVHDNQVVHAGDVLFTIDPARYDLALRQAEATLDMRKAQLEQALRDETRADSLKKIDAVSAASSESQRLAADVAKANLAEAVVELDTAKLNSERTQVKAQQDGTISNFSLRAGNYAVAGKGVFAIVATPTMYVVGYFEETRLPKIKLGDAAKIRLMGVSTPITGHVESIAAGIADRERTDSSDLLANVNPTFSWVRLAQRVPVRIALDPLPDGVELISGQTASVTILHK